MVAHYSLPIIELTGTAFERGRAHGSAARRQIAAACHYYSGIWNIAPGRLRGRIAKLLHGLEMFDPSLVDEARGIAHGAERTLEEILALNARNELLFAPAEDPDPEGCTIIAATYPATERGFVYMGQNWDWAPRLGSSSVLLKIRGGHEPDMLVFVDAGRLAMHGLNETGLGLCGNYLETPAYPPGPGVPIAFIRRKALTCESVADAEHLIRSTRRSTSTNYLLAHASGAVRNLETTTQEVLAIDAVDGVVVHTNHFCHADAPTQDAGLERVPDSTERLASARALFAAVAPHTVDSSMLKRVLADHAGFPTSICRHGDDGPGWHTLASHVMDLKSRSIEVAVGNPCETSYQKVSL